MDHAMAIWTKNDKISLGITADLVTLKGLHGRQVMYFDELVLFDAWVSSLELKAASLAFVAAEFFDFLDEQWIALDSTMKSKCCIVFNELIALLFWF